MCGTSASLITSNWGSMRLLKSISGDCPSTRKPSYSLFLFFVLILSTIAARSRSEVRDTRNAGKWRARRDDPQSSCEGRHH